MLNIKDNPVRQRRDVLFVIDKTPFHIAELNARARLVAQSIWRRIMKPIDVGICQRNYISAEDLDSANLNVKAMQASGMSHWRR